MNEDTRNVQDDLKGLPHEEIIRILDKRGVDLEVAVENTLRDYNMGTLVRNANAFGVRTVHVIGRRQWNKRGAMMTDKYVTIHYHPSVEAFGHHMSASNRSVVAIDITPNSVPLQSVELPKNAVLLFGQEGPGLSEEALAAAVVTAHIEQLGSTRSVNVGVASGIAMYEWLRRNN